MASMNYCLTVCHTADQKVLQQIRSNPIDISQSNSPTIGTSFFERLFSFGSTPSSSQLSNRFTVKASSFTDIDEDLF